MPFARLARPLWVEPERLIGNYSEDGAEDPPRHKGQNGRRQRFPQSFMQGNFP